MADEHATITLTLTDEMSDRLEAVNVQLDGVSRRFTQIAQQKPFQGQPQQTNELFEALKKIAEGFEKTGKGGTSALGPLVKTLTDLAASTGIVGKTLSGLYVWAAEHRLLPVES
jgi:hypothetical protein